MLAAALLSVSKVGGWHWCLSFGQELDGDHSCHLLTDLMGCWGGGLVLLRFLPGLYLGGLALGTLSLQ